MMQHMETREGEDGGEISGDERHDYSDKPTFIRATLRGELMFIIGLRGRNYNKDLKPPGVELLYEYD